MSRNDRNIEELFRTLFEQFTVNPSPGLWQKVHAKVKWKQFLSFGLNSFNVYYLALMLALMIWIGVNPTPFLERMEPSVQAVIEQVTGSDLQAQAVPEAEVEVTLTDANSQVEEEDPMLLSPTHWANGGLSSTGSPSFSQRST